MRSPGNRVLAIVPAAVGLVVVALLMSSSDATPERTPDSAPSGPCWDGSTWLGPSWTETYAPVDSNCVPNQRWRQSDTWGFSADTAPAGSNPER